MISVLGELIGMGFSIWLDHSVAILATQNWVTTVKYGLKKSVYKTDRTGQKCVCAVFLCKFVCPLLVSYFVSLFVLCYLVTLSVSLLVLC